MKSGEVLVNDEQVKSGFVLSPGDAISVSLPEPPEVPDYSDTEIDVIFEDEHICVVDKPIGLVVHPGVQNQTGTLVQILESQGMELSALADEERPGLVHRLDKETSGLLVLAKSDLAYESLVEQFSSRSIEKFYVVLANGVLKDQFVRVEAPLGRDSKHRPKMKVKMNGGKEAITELALLKEVDEEKSLLIAKLITGRTHQIRVHLEAIGHSVAGDDVYGTSMEKRAWNGRMMLHAWRLNLKHPESDEWIEFRSALPSEFSALVEASELEIALLNFESR